MNPKIILIILNLIWVASLAPWFIVALLAGFLGDSSAGPIWDVLVFIVVIIIWSYPIIVFISVISSIWFYHKQNYARAKHFVMFPLIPILFTFFFFVFLVCSDGVCLN
ncbi:MAG: hypothetical protein HYT93_04680 [Parcubacteria group bacterium]|nr:hypothetical protein [Parcubacteria group bacterium]